MPALAELRRGDGRRIGNKHIGDGGGLARGETAMPMATVRERGGRSSLGAMLLDARASWAVRTGSRMGWGSPTGWGLDSSSPTGLPQRRSGSTCPPRAGMRQAPVRMRLPPRSTPPPRSTLPPRPKLRFRSCDCSYRRWPIGQ